MRIKRLRNLNRNRARGYGIRAHKGRRIVSGLFYGRRSRRHRRRRR
ncbi:hypothetical protein [Dipodfec virus UOA04_Rod_1011]|nr:hypothetical protein [Dipodfec virus UOA04_Rod_1011]